MAANRTVVKLAHHEQQELCVTRPAYRQGKKLTAVKVYTVNDESQHLMICGVPKLQLHEEVKKLASPYGDIKKVLLIPEYPTEEEFTEVFHVHYGRIQSARIAKRFIDGKNFYGGILHVFYAPELETLSETRAKLIQRRRDISTRIKRNLEDTGTDAFVPKEQYHRKKKTPALPLTEDRLSQSYPGESLSSIYHGIPKSIDPRPISEPSLPENWSPGKNSETKIDRVHSLVTAPYQATEEILMANERRKLDAVRSKNYKGRYVRDSKSTKLTRPHIIDTRNMPIKLTIPKLGDPEDKKVFSNTKKVETGIKIKLLDDKDKKKKRIVIKNSKSISLIQSNPDLQSSINSAKSQIREAMQRKLDTQ